MKVLSLPIEPIPMRYSEQWDAWFREGFARAGFDFEVVYGEASSLTSLAPGNFLDPVGTWRWKFTQLDRAVRRAAELGDCLVFLHDAWMPGVEAFGYLRDLAKMNVRVCGFFHAGAYDPTDMLAREGMSEWVLGSEESWASLMDAVFVGTRYHAEKIPKTARSVHVTGIPVATPPGARDRREPLVVFPGRLSGDKRPETFDRLKGALAGVAPEAEWVRTHDLRMSKGDYYDLLGRAAAIVSFATHENFGISIVEGMSLGACPVVPDGLAYTETVPLGFRYGSFDEAVAITRAALSRRQRFSYHNPYEPQVVVDRVTRIMSRIARGEPV